jgi:hypothetical protein
MNDMGINSGALKKLKDRLYKKEETFEERRKRMRIYGENIGQMPSYWQSASGEKKDGSAMKTIFISLIILLFIGASAAALYFWFSESNIISSRNISLEIKGPTYIEGGKISNFNVFVENKNKTNLEVADLILEFPEGAYSIDGAALKRERISLGEIKSNERIGKLKDIVFLGLENEEKKVNIVLEYRLAGSSAIFTKNNEYLVKISRPAIGVSVLMPKETNSMREIEIKIEAVSNSELAAKNIFLHVLYPSGFYFGGAVPKPSEGDNVWSLGDINSLEKREIIIKGIIEGQDLEEKAFNVSVGATKEDENLISFGNASASLIIKRSPFNLSLFINGKDEERNTARAGDLVNLDLQWVNNTQNAVRNATIELQIKGDVYDERSISARGGAYRAFDKKIIWNSSGVPELSLVSPGDTGRVQCNFSVLDLLPAKSINDKNFSIILESKISGMETSEESQAIEIFDNDLKEIKIASPINFTSTAFYYSGPFKNSGPMPPRIGQETTYTIVWSLSGVSNDLSNVKATASLPSYARWLGVVSPEGAEIKYEERGGNVVWNAGYIHAGTGVVMPPKEVVFNIAFTPGSNLEGLSPALVSEGVLEGRDNFIEEDFKRGFQQVDIILKNDPNFKYEEGKVIR